jgi:hypothetical protein
MIKKLLLAIVLASVSVTSFADEPTKGSPSVIFTNYASEDIVVSYVTCHDGGSTGLYSFADCMKDTYGPNVFKTETLTIPQGKASEAINLSPGYAIHVLKARTVSYSWSRDWSGDYFACHNNDGNTSNEASQVLPVQMIKLEADSLTHYLTCQVL